MEKLKKVFGSMASMYGREFAINAIQDLLYHEVKSRKMTVKESERIFQAIKSEKIR